MVILAFCAIAYGITLTFDTAPAALAQNVQPATFPRLVIGVIAVLTLVMMAPAWRRERRAKPPVPPMVWLSAGVMIAFVLAFQWFGVVPALLMLCLGLPLLWGERRLVLVVPFGLGFPLLVHLLFVEVLGVHFEAGVLDFW